MQDPTPTVDEDISYEGVKQLFRDADAPVLTATEVASAFDVTRQAANYRLDKLHQRNEVERMEVGSSAVVWWLVEDQKNSLDTISSPASVSQ